MKHTNEVRKIYPETVKEFENIELDLLELFSKKQLDYGPRNISMGTPLETEEDIKLSLIGLAVRMNDKVSRLINLLIKGTKPNNESLEDTFTDLANYSIMALIVKKQKWGK